MTLAAVNHCAKLKVVFQSIVASAAGDVKTEATKVFEKYQSSFTAELESPVVQSANAEPFRLQGLTFFSLTTGTSSTRLLLTVRPKRRFGM